MWPFKIVFKRQPTKQNSNPVRWKRGGTRPPTVEALHLLEGKTFSDETCTCSLVSWGISVSNVVKIRKCVLSNYYNLGLLTSQLLASFYLQCLHFNSLLPFLLLSSLPSASTPFLQDSALSQLSHRFPSFRTTKGLCPFFFELFAFY